MTLLRQQVRSISSVGIDHTLNLERELALARQLATDLRHNAALAAFPSRIETWGLGFAVFADSFYIPAPGGDSAFVVAAEEGGALLDLVACRLGDRSVATRLGVAGVLGADWIYYARWTGTRLPLFNDPFGWLQAGSVGAVIVDWGRGPSALEGVSSISCASKSLARRLRCALMKEGLRPAIFYERADHE